MKRVAPRSRERRVAPFGAPSHYTLASGELVGAVFGLGLLVVTFLPWYSSGGENATAWQAFGVTDIVLAAAAATAISAGLVVLLRLSVSYPVAGSSVAAGLGVVAFVLVVIRLINPPGGGDVDREVGGWLGLLATAGIAWGGWLGMQEPRPSGHQAALS